MGRVAKGFMAAAVILLAGHVVYADFSADLQMVVRYTDAFGTHLVSSGGALPGGTSVDLAVYDVQNWGTETGAGAGLQQFMINLSGSRAGDGSTAVIWPALRSGTFHFNDAALGAMRDPSFDDEDMANSNGDLTVALGSFGVALKTTLDPLVGAEYPGGFKAGTLTFTTPAFGANPTNSYVVDLTGSTPTHDATQILSAPSWIFLNYPIAGSGLTGGTFGFTLLPPPATMVWTGAVNTNWGAGQPANWSLAGEGRAYMDGDHVIIDGTAGTLLTLVGTVYPGSVLVSNTSGNVVLGGTGSIAGPFGLTKNGSGTLTLATSNSYTGDTVINAGTVIIAAESALGASVVRLGDTGGSNSASLLAGGAFTVSRPITVQDDGSLTSLRLLGGNNTAGTAVCSGNITVHKDLTLTAALGGTVRFDGALDDPEGHTITKAGEGIVILDGLQTYGAGTLLDVTAGVLDLNADGGANLSITVTDAGVNFGCDQHLDTLTIGDGGKVVLAGAQVVVLNHLVMGGMDLGAAIMTPEPATLALLALGGLGVLARRWRK